MIIIPDIIHQKLSGMVINAVVALRRSVNITINTPAEPIITNGLYRFCVASDDHIITGKTGRTQGASTVNTQANSDNSANIIIQER